jgi:two-component system chemotaxis response regulator CheB
MPQRDIIVIGGSAGGVEAVSRIAAGLPAGFAASVFVVIHFPADGTSHLPRILNRAGPVPAQLASDGEPVRPGRIYVAVPDHHLVLENGVMRCERGPKENNHRPAVDPLFRSAAEAYGPRVAGVIVSGTRTDGTAGLFAVKKRGGIAIVEDPATALHSSMPASAAENVAVDHIVPAGDIAAILADAAPPESRSPMPTAPRQHDAEQRALDADLQRNPGAPAPYTCPECHGTLWEAPEEQFLTFRCRVGHAYSGDALFGHQGEVLEAAMWTALRSLEEHAALSRRLAARASDRSQPRSARIFTEEATHSERHARVIREALNRGATAIPLTTDQATDVEVVG